MPLEFDILTARGKWLQDGMSLSTKVAKGCSGSLFTMAKSKDPIPYLQPVAPEHADIKKTGITTQGV